MDAMNARTIRVATDVGGTFTDLVYFETDGATGRQVVRTAKVDTTPPDYERGVLDVLAKGKVDAADIVFFAHGTTVVINALTERKGVVTALITTEGFRDVIEIGRQNRASLYDLTAHGPAPLVPREHRFVVRERMGPEGVVDPLDPASLRDAVTAVAAAEVEAVAVCLLFSFLHPEH